MFNINRQVFQTSDYILSIMQNSENTQMFCQMFIFNFRSQFVSESIYYFIKID